MPATDKGGLYRNWKGYLLWAEPCRNADSGQPGCLIQILTGPRAGEREWRSARDWERSPNLAPGLPRYEPVADPLPWCPIVQAQAVFREEFPAAPAVPILWDPEHDCPGACYYRRDGRAEVILLDPRLSLVEATNVLLHELAHVIADRTVETEEHGPIFEQCHARLMAAYEVRSRLKSQIPGMAWITGEVEHASAEKQTSTTV